MFLFTPPSPTILSDSLNSIDSISPLTFSPIFTPTGPMTLSLEYSQPIIGFYETIDNDPDVRSKMLKYYFDLLRDDWLLDDLNDVLNYFTFKNGQVAMIN